MNSAGYLGAKQDTKSTRGSLVLSLGVIALSVGPVQAHHSYAPYDLGHPVTVSGTVTQFRWTNPHGWVHLMVPNAQGVAEEWVIETPAVSAMVRWGWRANTLKPGDKVHLIIGPMRDGTHGGSLAGAVDDSGKVINAGRLPDEYANSVESKH